MTGLSNLNYSFGFNGRKMFDFLPLEKDIGWILIIDHLVSQQIKVLHFAVVLKGRPCAFHIWESGLTQSFGLKKKKFQGTTRVRLIAFCLR